MLTTAPTIALSLLTIQYISTQSWRPATLAQNELKTLDRIRAFGSQWQYITAGLGYNSQLVNETVVKAITVTAKTRAYIGWGTTCMSMWVTDGFCCDGVTLVNEAWMKASANRTRIEYVDHANEGSMVQNASYYAAVIASMYGIDSDSSNSSESTLAGIDMLH